VVVVVVVVSGFRENLLSTYFDYLQFVGHNFEILHCRRVCNCRFTAHILYIICRH
jgi:hypothetical protein